MIVGIDATMQAHRVCTTGDVPRVPLAHVKERWFQTLVVVLVSTRLCLLISRAD